MKYIINSTNIFLRDLEKYGHYETEDARDAADWIIEHSNTEDAYDEMLDECYEEIEICGCSYAPSVALYRVDPTAYSCGKSDWEDSQAQDIAYDINRMDNEDESTFYDYTVTAIDEDEENEDETKSA